MTLAVGDVICAANVKRAVCLMTGTTANTSPPSLVTDGIPAYPNESIYSSDTGAFFAVEYPDISTLVIRSTAGSGTMTGTFTLWGYLAASGAWYPVKVNGGSAIAETSADQISYAEKFTGLGHFDRLFLELASVGGTAPAFEAFIISARKAGS